jgi:hypothetical protein
MARKHIHAPPRRNAMPTESHSDGQNAGYFPRTLQTVLLVLSYSEPPLFIGTLRLLHGNSYPWCVCVVIYKRPMTDHIHHVHQVIEASTLRWTIEGGMREVAREAFAVLRHEASERMENSQYYHFPSRAKEGVEVVVLPIGDHDRIGCFAN